MKPSLSLIRRALGAATFQRGVACHSAGKVLEFGAEPHGATLRLTGSTAGPHGAVYHQDVKLAQKPDDLDVDGHCTCPVLYNCEHVAAVCCAWAASRRPSAARTATTPAILRWLGELARVEAAPAPQAAGEEHVAYLLQAVSQGRGSEAREVLRLEARVVKRSAQNGRPSRGRSIDLSALTLGHGRLSGVATALDREIATLLAGLSVYHSVYALRGCAAYHALQLLIESGRMHWAAAHEPALTRGPGRRLRLRWRPSSSTLLALETEVDGGGWVIASEPPLYVDPERNCIGALDSGGLSGAQLALLETAPPLPMGEAERVATELVSKFGNVPIPPPVAVTIRENRGHSPRAILRLTGRRDGPRAQTWALLDVAYADDVIPIDPGTATTTLKTRAGYVTVARDPDAERALSARLESFGFERAASSPDPQRPEAAAYLAFGTDELDDATRWATLLAAHAELEDEGWSFAVDAGFPLRFETAEWVAEIGDGSAIDWFELSFELQVGEERVPLLDALAPVFGMDWAKLPEIVVVPLAAQRYLEIPAARLRPLLDTLTALFGRERRGRRSRLSRYDVALLDELAAHGVALRGGQRWRDLAVRLRDFSGVAPVLPDPGVRAELRAYQIAGLSWLQFLREYGFNGILADDMGLGKTLQTLAHLMSEKRAGRLDVPALVVAPTSLMGNWQREAARFTPELDVRVLHGPQRHSLFDAATHADLILTSYALLPRDEARLQRLEFHSVILDEAQNVKNPRAKASQVIRRLTARHRLCLTGTPIENHLGELWALFDFLMPGFLGDSDSFRQRYRTPIETHRDLDRQRTLRRRIAPFVLRRTKQAVAAELPPKTEIVERVEFSTHQAERYESVRVTVDRRVREAIERQGFARSRIAILDALLKLRQICCDPRLLDPTAAEVPSAKLERLLELLHELHDEGRRVLVFSQFTSMLALIESALTGCDIPSVKLTGQTRKRDETIEVFRRGEVGVFLISLKAGGVGLNLPEADTVIHYDPWWNPAVEAQATDRAHRIGQTQPVFVYKLIVNRSVEEKMLELQTRKRELTALFANGGGDDDVFAIDDSTLAELLEPLG